MAEDKEIQEGISSFLADYNKSHGTNYKNLYECLVDYEKDYVKDFNELNNTNFKSLNEIGEAIAKNEREYRKLDRPIIPTRVPLPKPKYFGLMNDKVSNSLAVLPHDYTEINGQLKMNFLVDQSGKKRQAIVMTSLTYEGGDIQTSKKLTAFDMATYNSIATIYHYWKLDKDRADKPLRITAAEVWRIMTGKTDSKSNPSPKQIERVAKSIDKMAFTRIYMDISQEIQKKYISINDERITGGRLEQYLINADKVVFYSEKGKELIGYKINQEPILYTYNKAKDHILWIDNNLLDTSKYIGASDYVIEFRNYLLQQIELIKNNKGRDSNRILLETLYKKTAIPTPEERASAADVEADTPLKLRNRAKFESRKDREKIEAILNSFKDKSHIKEFKTVQVKNKFVGYDIIL